MAKTDKPSLLQRFKRNFIRVKSYNVALEISWRLQPVGTVIITAGGRDPMEAEEKAKQLLERELLITTKHVKKDRDFEISNNV
jgi:hypothetical protein